MSIDFRDAFCHFANDRREWKHCITPDEKDAQALMWVAMTFGYKGAPLIMARLSSAVGRLIQSLLRPFEGKCQIYMDDLLIILRGPKFHRDLLISMILHVLEIFGVQVAHEKGERGTRVSWIGTTLEIKDLKTLVIGIQEKMIQELQNTMAEWPSKGMLPVKELRKVTGKLSWVAGILPRLKWIVNIFYGTLAAVEREEREGTEASRAGNRGDTRPKVGLVAFKRISMAVEWVMKLLSNFEAKLILERPLTEQPIQLGIVTDASPLGLGGMLIRLQADSERFEILEAFEIRFLKEDAALLNVEHGAPSSQAVVETLAILRAVIKWATAIKGKPILVRSDSTAALGVTAKLGGNVATLNFLAAELALRLEMLDIEKVIVQHLRGRDNKETDWLSRVHDRGEMPDSLRNAKLMRLGPIFRDPNFFRLRPPGAKGGGSMWSQTQFKGPSVAVKLG